ncbi:protein roadkill [Caerostris darwini]|uniref:Protein roadkill n=1 Tax=Caerostris darwini TaxID=1538125 RepID=A0AAV4MDS7_9ARAC|nr:protein roadkill [Caerostris darwini]
MSLEVNRKPNIKKFVWTIENFSLITSQPGGVFSSPSFNTKSDRQTWVFLIYPKSIVNEKYISLYFAKDSAIDNKLYNCTLSIGSTNGKIFKSKQYLHVHFSNIAIGGECFMRRDHYRHFLKGPVKIQCELSEICHGCDDETIEYKNLSQDLKNLYESQQYSDLTLYVDQHEFKVHRSILSVRSPSLPHVLGYHNFEDLPKSVEVVSGLSPEKFEQLIRYVYTGELQSGDVSSELFDYSNDLKLHSLEKSVYEEPNEYHTHSVVNAEELNIIWNLDNIGPLEGGSVISSQILETTEIYSPQLVAQLAFSDKGDNGKFLDVLFRFNEFDEERPILFVCKMTLTYQDCSLSFKEVNHVFTTEDWHFPEFIKDTDIIQKSNSLGGMCLKAELIMSDNSTTFSTKSYTNEIFDNAQHITANYEQLSNDIGLLSQRGEYVSDLILFSSHCDPFLAHKAILWARWPEIRDELPLDSDMKEIKIAVDGEILGVLMEYIYSGKIQDFDEETAAMLLEVDKKTPKLPYSLVKKCEKFLEDAEVIHF